MHVGADGSTRSLCQAVAGTSPLLVMLYRLPLSLVQLSAHLVVPLSPELPCEHLFTKMNNLSISKQ